MEPVLLWIRATNSEYDLNDPQELGRMRDDLASIGFFFYPENRQYWGMFERHAKKKEVESLISSILVFEIKSGKVKQKHAD